MCGICGFYSKNSLNFNNTILNMNSAISHRGPDSSGFWQDNDSGIVLGHQRLSIIDLSKAANQPMMSSSGRFVLTYNGEIYNYLEIREELQRLNSNIKWKSSSDTETLLEAIDFWGIEKTIKKIVGMFAFAVWDRKNRSLVLARDRIGEKPIYYGWQGNGDRRVFIFGSELKALKAHPEFNRAINREAVALQLRHNYIPDPYSIYENIYKLLPGHYIELSNQDLKKGFLPRLKTYWSVTDCVIQGVNNQFKSDEIELQKVLKKKLELSIKRQMISDVPIGAFLSGGIDSSTVVALMRGAGAK